MSFDIKKLPVKKTTYLNMAIKCSKCKLYRPNHEVRNRLCEECYEDSEYSSSEDSESSSSEDEASSLRSELRSEVTLQKEIKSCTKCKKTKQLELFHKNKSKKDGRRSTCKECRNVTVKHPEYKIIDQSHLLCTKCNTIITKAYKYRHLNTTKHKDKSQKDGWL